MTSTDTCTTSSSGAAASSAPSLPSARSSTALAPRVPTASLSSLPPRRPPGQGDGEDPPLGGPQGVTSPLHVSVFSGVCEPWLGCLGPKSSAGDPGPSPRPSFASRPSGPSARSAARRARDNPRLVWAPASGAFGNPRLRLFSRAEPQPGASSQGAAQQPGSPSQSSALRGSDPGAQRAPGAGLCAVSASSPPWPPGAPDSRSCCSCCCCCRRLLWPRLLTDLRVDPLSTQVNNPGRAERARGCSACPSGLGRGGSMGVGALPRPVLFRTEPLTPDPELRVNPVLGVMFSLGRKFPWG